MKPGNRTICHGANSSWGLPREIREVTYKKEPLIIQKRFFSFVYPLRFCSRLSYDRRL
ncbi:MAG: hypothetical protein DDT21_01503 [Syntrophomonadaceae bacterium]|nr:hypothetical protein [Bacillota bacterium]